jgi:hypothetical protein
MMRWVDCVVEALQALGGQADYHSLYKYIEDNPRRILTKEWQATVRQTIERHSSDSKNYEQPNEDLFYAPLGLGKGVWALRSESTIRRRGIDGGGRLRGVKEDKNQYDFAVGIGTTYVYANEEVKTTASVPFSIDPNELDRSLRAHAKAQNALARELQARHIKPLSPNRSSGSPEPDFDIAWLVSGNLWVAEVKSLHPTNEVHQLRLGLGQILDFQHAILSQHTRVSFERLQPVLLVDIAPSKTRWVELCQQQGVILTWPHEWQGLF